MSYIFRHLLCLLLLVTVKQTAQAQGQYPVTASTQIIPPYSVYLPDYAVPGSDKLRVILVQNDLTQPSYDILLQMTVERNGAVIMRSAPTFRPKPLTLNAGVPTIIGGTDLYDYLQTRNIVFSNGFSANDYDRTKSLPEGAYRISFTAFDYSRPQVQVSNTGANIFFFQKNDPPLLNLPVCGSRVEKHDPQFLTFNWSSRNTPSPFANSATEYVFSLYEIKPKGSNPDYILRSARPLYTTVTATNTIVYGPGEPALTDSMEYVWVVQARDKSGRDLFSNQGLSQSCKFTYLGTNPFAANNIGKPKFYGKATGERTIHLYWPLAPESVFYNVKAYRVQYRAAKKDGVEFDWHTAEKQRDTVLDLNSLEPGHAYEAQLQWKVAGVYGPLSELVKITTDTARAFDCSDAGPMPPAANAKPLASASIGNIVKNGFFDVILTAVSGANGTFSGKGRIITPGFGIGLSLTFKSITINENMVVTKGEMQAVTEGIDKFTSDAVKEQRGGNDVGQVKTGDIVPDITTNLHIFSPQQIKVDTEAGTITLTDKDGKPQEVINYQDKGKTLPMVLEDADGNLYNIDKNGHVTTAGTRNNQLAGNTAALNTLRLDKGKVTFAAGAGNKYAFDAWKDSYAGKPVLDASYEKLADGKYRVSAKAIVPGVQETVTATLENAAADMAAKISFVSGKGITYPSERNGNTFTVTLTGGPAGDAQEVYAVYQDSSKYKSLGKLLVASYAPLQRKVVLIPVGTATVPEQDILSSLQKAYGKIGVNYSVTTDNSFLDNKDWDLDHNNVLQDTKSAFLSNNFTGEEKAMKQAYSKGRSLDDEAAYLFLVNEAALKDGDLQGKMPRQSQFGFIFVQGASAADIGHTVAHETGHGAYTLEHTFSAGIGLTMGSTDNIMDYSGGYGLLKYQWDVVHDPGNVWGIFEGDGESQLEKGLSRYKCLNDEVQKALAGKRLFYAPDGQVVELPEGAAPVAVFYTDMGKTNPVKPGSISSFRFNNKEYNALYDVRSKSFVAYSYDKETPATFIKAHQQKAGEEVTAISVAGDVATCGVTIGGVTYANEGCICQDNIYKKNYDKLMAETIDSDKPEVKAAIDSLCRLIAELPDGTLRTNNELFNCYYNNLDLYWYDWNTAPKVLTLDQIRKMRQDLKDLDANINKLKQCDFKTGDEIVDFVQEHFVISGTRKSYLTDAQFKELSPATRICLIEKLLDGKYEQRYTVGSDDFGGQNIMVQVLRNCKTSQELYDVVKQIDTDKKLYDLLSKTYDYLYFSNGNFTQLCSAVTVAYITAVIPTQKEELAKSLMASGKWILFDNGYLTARNEEDFHDANRKITFKVSDGVGAIPGKILDWIDSDASWIFQDFGKATAFNGSFDPLELLIMIPKRDINAFGGVFQKGVPYVLPALSVYELFKMDTEAAIGTSTELTLNTALCALGLGELAAAGRAAAAAEMIDIGLSTFVVYANSAREMYQDHPVFTKISTYLSIIYSVGRLGNAAVQAYREAKVSVPAAMVADDAAEIERRAALLSADEAAIVERGLNNLKDDNFYIVVHSDGNNFTVIHDGAPGALDHNSLAKWIDDQNIPASRQLVLLSCADLKTAQNLGKKMNRSLVANDGWVTIHENGVIEGEHAFRRITPEGNIEEAPIAKLGADEAPDGLSVTLGKSKPLKIRWGRLDLGKFIGKRGDYEVYANGEVIYRGMNKADFAYFKEHKIIPPAKGNSEMFTSPTLEYITAGDYRGIIVKFQMKPGTLEKLEAQGIRDASNRAALLYPNMPNPPKFAGWMDRKQALFKQEPIRNTDKVQVNIGLGRRTDGALETFNENILTFEVIE